MRRLAGAHSSSQGPIWLPGPTLDPDVFTLTGSGDDTHTLTYLPSGLNLVTLNTVPLAFGTDFTVDWTTGTLTLLGTLAASDVLEVWYVTTGELVAGSLPAETDAGPATYVDSAITTTNGTATTATINIPAGTVADDLMLAFHHTVNADTVSTTPSGWTLEGTPPGSSDVVVYSKIAGAGESAATITKTTGQRSTVHTRTYRGTSIAVQSAVYNRVTSATSCPLGSGSVSGDPTLVHFYGLSDSGANITATPTEMVNDTSGVNSALETQDGDEDLTGVTSIPARSATCDNAVSWTSAAVLVQAG